MSFHSQGINPVVDGLNLNATVIEDYEDRLDALEAVGSATFVSSATHVIRKNGAFFEAYKNSVLTFGGADDAGSIDGTDPKAVIEAAWNDALGDNVGTVYVKGLITLSDGLELGMADYCKCNFVFEHLRFDNTYNGDLVTFLGNAGGGGAGSYYAEWNGFCLGGTIETEHANFDNNALNIKNIISGRFNIGQLYNSGWGAGTRGVNSVGLMLESDGTVGYACELNDVTVKEIKGFYTGIKFYAHDFATSGIQVVGNEVHDIHIFYAIIGVDQEVDDPLTASTGFNTFRSIDVNMTHWDPQDSATYGFIVGHAASDDCAYNIYIDCHTHDEPSDTLIASFYTPFLYSDATRPVLFGCHTSAGYPAVGDFTIIGCTGGLVLSGTALTFSREIPVLIHGWTETKVGTGNVAQYPMYLGLYTGADPNSSGLAYAYTYGLTPGGSGNPLYCDFRYAMQFSFTANRLVVDAQVSGRVQLKPTSAIGQLADEGLGVTCLDDHWYGDCYRTGYSVVDLSVDDNAAHDFQIVLDPGVSVKYYVDKVLKGTISTAANVPSTYHAAQYYLVASIANGAAGGNLAELDVSNLMIKQDTAST